MFLVLLACGSAVLAGSKIGGLGIGLCCDLVLLRLVNYIGISRDDIQSCRIVCHACQRAHEVRGILRFRGFPAYWSCNRSRILRATDEHKSFWKIRRIGHRSRTRPRKHSWQTGRQLLCQPDPQLHTGTMEPRGLA